MIGGMLQKEAVFLINLLKNKQTYSTLPHPISFPTLIELQQTDSTNNYAMQMVRDGMAQNGQAVLAYHQTAGKGQRTKSWISEDGKGLNLSILASAEFLTPANGFPLLAATAVAVTEELFETTGKEFKIKWPNDLYWNDRKAGGILTQSVIQGSVWKWAVIGIGINVLQENFPSELPNPVSLKQISGTNIDIRTLAENIRNRLMQHLVKLKAEGFDQIHGEYLKRLYKLEKNVLFKYKDQEMNLFIRGVSKEGMLETGNEEHVQYAFGELEWVHKF
jgi:BirA family biotin operon repressor/biotin-[acetyl-CoA-carboxylase] ligase